MSIRSTLCAVSALIILLVVPLDGSAQSQRRMRTMAAPAGQLTGDPVPFLDGHVHLNDAAAWVAVMDQAQIPQSVVFAGRGIGNAGLLAAADAWPGRFFPFFSISPEHREFRGAWEADDTALVAIADSLLAAGGFFGIGEISVTHFPGTGFPEADFDPTGRIMRGLVAVAGKWDVPITIHVEITRLREFEALLDAYPDVTVIMAHGGYAPLFLARRLLEQHPNLIFELSARTWAQHPRSPDYTILMDGSRVWPEWLALITEMPSRFIVGTDASIQSATSDLGKISSVWNVLGQLYPEVREQVARTNLLRIIGGGGARHLSPSVKAEAGDGAGALVGSCWPRDGREALSER
jgi:hypothetical protein